MSTTLEELIITDISEPPATPPRSLAVFDPQDVEHLPSGVRHTGGELELGAERAAQSPDRPTQGPLAISRSGNEMIVSDLLGAVYGVGVSPESALEDYWQALDAHLAFLREREPVLHPRLARELEVLTRLFPDR